MRVRAVRVQAPYCTFATGVTVYEGRTFRTIRPTRTIGPLLSIKAGNSTAAGLRKQNCISISIMVRGLRLSTSNCCSLLGRSAGLHVQCKLNKNSKQKHEDTAGHWHSALYMALSLSSNVQLARRQQAGPRKRKIGRILLPVYAAYTHHTTNNRGGWWHLASDVVFFVHSKQTLPCI